MLVLSASVLLPGFAIFSPLPLLPPPFFVSVLSSPVFSSLLDIFDVSLSSPGCSGDLEVSGCSPFE